MGKTLYLVSLGCTKNLVDSEIMLGKLHEYHVADDPAEADVIIINTCGFIEAAKSESISEILEVHRQRKKDSLLVVSGCLSERYRKELAEQLPEVDIFTGVGDYARIDEIIRERKNAFTPEVFLADEHYPRKISGSTYHAYVKIAEGCNQRCSFCAIPSFKGKLHSRNVESIVAELLMLTGRGFHDISFISQDSSSFGRDAGNEGLADLIRRAETVPGLHSARVLYLYPSTTDSDLVKAIADSPVFRTYYDMPIQHIDDRMLKIMKRGAGSSRTRKILEEMRSQDGSFVRTSVIAGHPGETEKSFKTLCRFLEDFGFDRINVFAYSNEEDTAAFGMQQLPPETIEERTSILGEISRHCRNVSMEKMVGEETLLAIDGKSGEHDYLLSARPLIWAPEIDGEVLVNDTADLKVKTGRIYKARITEKVGEYLTATLLEEI
jgi:ribosomal protein S12 methylthiotransferase RimO